MEFSIFRTLNITVQNILSDMSLNFEACFYSLLIDPILLKIQKRVLPEIKAGNRVLDIACGTGSFSMLIAGKAGSVSGIDISDNFIDMAIRNSIKRGIHNLSFTCMDASDLSGFSNREFDVSVTSMSVHQFDEKLALKILSEMKRISGKVILIDYNFPLPVGFYGRLASGIERLAGGDHYRNFKKYIKNGGITYYTANSGLNTVYSKVTGKGVFKISVCN